MARLAEKPVEPGRYGSQPGLRVLSDLQYEDNEPNQYRDIREYGYQLTDFDSSHRMASSEPHPPIHYEPATREREAPGAGRFLRFG